MDLERAYSWLHTHGAKTKERGERKREREQGDSSTARRPKEERVEEGLRQKGRERERETDRDKEREKTEREETKRFSLCNTEFVAQPVFRLTGEESVSSRLNPFMEVHHLSFIGIL